VNNRLDGYGDTGMDSGMGGRRGGISLRNLRTFSSLKNPVYRIFYFGMLGQMAGMNIQIFAGVWLLMRMTDSPIIVGAMTFAHALPMLSLSLFGGALADRVQKKYILLIGQIVSILVSLGTALALSLNYLSPERTFAILGFVIPSWSILVAASFFQGTVMAFMMPSLQTIVPEIVGEEQLMNAVSLSNMGMNTLRVFAPAVTGFLIKAFDYEVVYYVMASMHFLSAIFMVFLPHTRKTIVPVSSAMASIKAGVSYLRNETTVLLVLILTLLTVILSMPYQMLLPFFCEDILNVDEGGGGVLMSVSGAGAIASSLVLASLPNKKRGLMMLISGILLGIALAGFSFSSLWSLALFTITFVGIGQSSNMALGTTLVQYYVEADYRGRIMSILMMQFGFMSLGTFIAGTMAESMGVQWALGGFAIALFFISTLALVFVPRLRKLD